VEMINIQLTQFTFVFHKILTITSNHFPEQLETDGLSYGYSVFCELGIEFSTIIQTGKKQMECLLQLFVQAVQDISRLVTTRIPLLSVH
jgi:hypothetical protein